MKECFKCGISEEKALLFEGISKNSIVNICRKCSFKENIPILKKRLEGYDLTNQANPGQKFELKTPPRRKEGQEVYKRLLKMSGINREEKIEERAKSAELKQQENDLKNLVEENFNKTIQKNQDLKINLVDNFNWVIMRARRERHIMRQQLAEKISEPEVAIKSLENGIYPINKRIIKKIEDYLGIKLLNASDSNQTEDKPKKISSDIFDDGNFTISDLKKLEE